MEYKRGKRDAKNKLPKADVFQFRGSHQLFNQQSKHLQNNIKRK